MKKLYFLLIGVFILTSFVSAEPTQQFNKIFLDPFYRSSMQPDTPYSYTVTINPPDRISEVKSAIITFSVWHNPTITYTLTVNGQSCVNPSFLVHTSYENAGNNEIYFDCTNIINKAGDYTIVLTPDDDTGTITGWVDLTYMNNPEGELSVWGTEYRAGERARIFLQLKDNQGLPENNGACYLDIYYPYRVNSTAESYITDAPMLHLDGSDGVYYYDIGELPEEYGVYMMTAGCDYELLSSFVYFTDGTDAFSPTRTSIQGTITGSTIVLDTYTDYSYEKCVASGGGTKYCQTEYDYDTTIHFGNTSNVTDLSLYYMGEASLDAELIFEAWNFTGSSWYQFPNNLTFSGNSPAQPIGLNDFASNSFPNVNDFINSSGIITVRLTALAGSSFQMYNNWLNINLRTASGTVQDLKGSSEIHVNDWFDHFRQSYTDSNWINFSGEVSDNILDQFTNHTWNYSDEINYNILNQIANETTLQVWNYSGTINDNILNQISNDVWNLFNSTYNFINLITESIWTREDRNLTYYEDVTDYQRIYEGVWNFTDRNLTYYESGEVVLNYTEIGEEIWNYSTRELTAQEHLWVGGTEYDVEEGVGKIVARIIGGNGEPVNGATCNISIFYPNTTVYVNDVMTNISTQSQGVYYYDFNLSSTLGVYTYGIDCNKLGQDYYLVDTFHVRNIAGEVWTYTPDRNLTYYPDTTINLNITNITVQTNITNQINLTNQLNITVSNNITFEPNITNQINLTNQLNITTIANISEVNISNINEIWEYESRNLTYTEDVTNYTLIEELITNRNDIINYTLIYELIENRTVNDLTNYTRIEELIENRNISDLTNYTLIYELIENRTVTDLTNYTLITELINNRTDIVDYNLIFDLIENRTDITNYDMIQEMVWNATVRTLTDFDFIVDVNLTQISEAVWNSVNRTLTDFNFTVDVDANEIADAVWSSNDRNLTYYENFTVPQLDLTDYQRIYEGVWNASNRSLTYYELTDVNESLIAETVWSYFNRTLTDFNFTVTAVVDDDLIAQTVWNYVNRSLTDNNNTDLTDYNLIQTIVWNATNRTLTDFNFTVETTINLSEVADAVWTHTPDRNLTYYENFTVPQVDLTDYNLIQTIVWNATTRTLTDFNFTVDVNLTEVSDAIWSAVNRSLTDYNQSDLTDYDLIQAMVWNATTRTLTEFNFTVDVNSSDLAQFIWNYADRNLTYYEDVTDYLRIYNGVWNATNRNLTYYELVDVSNLTVNVNSSEIAEQVWSYTGPISNNILATFGERVKCILNLLLTQEQGWNIEIPIC